MTKKSAQHNSPSIGDKRSREDSRVSFKAKKPKRVVRYFQSDPTPQSFDEITKNFAETLARALVEPRHLSIELKEQLVLFCEDLQTLGDRNYTWRQPIINWCFSLINTHLQSINKDQKSLEKLISTWTKEQLLAPIVLLMTDFLYAMQRVNFSDLQKIILFQLEWAVNQENSLWLAGWLGYHFPSIILPYLFKKLISAIPAKLPGITALKYSPSDTKDISSSLGITNLVTILQYLSKQLQTHWEQYLSASLENNEISWFYAILLFLPSTITLCSQYIVTTLRRKLKIMLNSSQFDTILECIFLRMPSFRTECLLLLRCILTLPSKYLENYKQFLLGGFELIERNSGNEIGNGNGIENATGEENAFTELFYQHIKDMRSCIIPLCQMAISSETEEKSIALAYLQIISLMTDEGATLEILFRIFLCSAPNSLSIFVQLLETAKDNFPDIQKHFIERVLDYLPTCSDVDLNLILSNIVFLENYETDNAVDPARSLIHPLATQDYFELFVGLLNSQNRLSIRIIVFKILELIIPRIIGDSIVVFLLIQKLLSHLLYCITLRTEKILAAFPNEVEDSCVVDITWMIHHIATLIKELCKNPMTSLQAIDLLLDLSFSKRVDGVIRAKISGPIPPANCLLLPNPIMLQFSFQKSEKLCSEKGKNYGGMLQYNRTRRLFGKTMQQEKHIPPPGSISTQEYEKKKLEKYCHTQNQQFFLDIVRVLLQQNPENYGKFTDILLTRITSSYPIPSDEQYLEILPRRSNYDFDVFVRKIFIQNPIFIGYLSILAESPVDFVNCLVIVKSLLANMIGDWNIVTNSGNDPDHIVVTIELLKALKKAKWFPKRLEQCYEILPLIPSQEGTQVLLSLWKFIRENIPKGSEFYDTETGKLKPEREIDYKRYAPHLGLIRQVLHRNINKVAPFYSNFFPVERVVDEEMK